MDICAFKNETFELKNALKFQRHKNTHPFNPNPKITEKTPKLRHSSTLSSVYSIRALITPLRLLLFN